MRKTRLYITFSHLCQDAFIAASDITIINKRNKEYLVETTFDIGLRTDHGTSFLTPTPSMAMAVRGALYDGSENEDVVVDGIHGDQIVVTRSFTKPGKMAPLSDGLIKDLGAALEAQVRVYISEREDARAQRARMEEANEVAHQIFDRSVEEAKRITNYEARLEGLRAELRATQRRTITDAVEWARKEASTMTEMDPRVIEAACLRAPEWQFVTEPMGAGQQQVVSFEDVK